MIKKMMLCLLALLMMAANAHAQEETPLPQSVIDLCAAAHPGYTVSVHDGWGSEDAGQFALVLSRDGDNILCLAEKSAGDAAYALVIDNTKAVHDGDLLPSLLIDTGGDALFYGYHEGGSGVTYHTMKEDGEWSLIDVLVLEPDGEGNVCVMSDIEYDHLAYRHYDEDINGNILSSWDYMLIPVSDAFIMRMLPQHFDIEAYSFNPEYGFSQEMLPGMCEGLLSAGETLVDLELKRDMLAMIVRGTDGLCRVRTVVNGMYDYKVLDSRYGVNYMSFDPFHADEGELILFIDGLVSAGFEKVDDLHFRLAWTMEEENLRYGESFVAEADAMRPYRSDGYAFGSMGTLMLDQMRLDRLPQTFEEAMEIVDQSGWAYVNNPVPTDRLHLRVRADKGATSLGKFYNRTPVYVLEDQGRWAKVRIGTGAHTLTGYMMKDYLVPAAANHDLACAYPQKQLRKSDRPDGTPLMAGPSSSSEMIGKYHQGSDEFIIGVAGDAWYVVLCADGSVGYVRQRAFWDGNG